MKILFVAPSNSVHTIRWLDRASKSGIQVHLYDQILGGGEKPSGYPAYFLQKRRVFQVFPVFTLIAHFFKLKKILKANNYDLVHGHWLFDIAMLALSFQKEIKLIITPWGSDIQYSPKKSRFRFVKIVLNKFIIKRLARKAIAVCCDSVAQSEILVSYGAEKDKIKIIYFGTDVDRFNPGNRSMELRSKYGAGEDQVLVISNRSHEEIYDLSTFLGAANVALKVNTNLRFVLAGSGSLTDSLKKQITELRMSEYFCIPGRMDDAEFASSTASCDIYVSTSKSDGGLAASTAEAMASGLPVLITDFGENKSWLRQESAGFAFDIGDSRKLAQLILKLSFDPNLRTELGKNGREIVTQDNNSVLEWKKVLNLYQNLI